MSEQLEQERGRPGLEMVSIDGALCATIVRREFRGEGIEFFTSDTDTLQLGYMRREPGYVIRPHSHRSVPRQVEFTNEVLIIRSGKVRVNFYDNAQSYRTSVILDQGDIILLAECGHGFEMLEECEIVEVKQGPYAGEADKLRF
jgi:mannose-6-phosphate isomerase-like protein (cupin superfamily)